MGVAKSKDRATNGPDIESKELRARVVFLRSKQSNFERAKFKVWSDAVRRNENCAHRHLPAFLASGKRQQTFPRAVRETREQRATAALDAHFEPLARDVEGLADAAAADLLAEPRRQR